MHIYDFHFDDRVGSPLDGQEAKMVVHYRPLYAVDVSGREVPGGGNATAGDVVNRIQVRGFQHRNFSVMHIARQKNNPVSAGLSDEFKHTRLFVREIGPSLVSIEFDAKLGAAANQPNIGRFFQLFLQPLPLGLAQ